MAAKIQWLENDQFEDLPGAERVRRARSQRSANSADADNPVPPFLLDPAVAEVMTIAKTFSKRVKPEAARRTARAPELAIAVDVDDGSDYLLVVRHPSGALSFHDGNKETGRRRTSAGGKSRSKRPKKYRIEFRVPVAPSANQVLRRNLIGSIVDGIIDAVVVKLTDFVAETAVNLAEKAIWKTLGRSRGLYRVVPKPGAGLDLKPVSSGISAGPSGRALLFIHGTFSTTQGGFGELTGSDFFDRVKDLYGNAIYGFDHFTVSVTPERNAQDLLAALPHGAPPFDVVTHSRGGLVLRNLVERRSELNHSDRFNLGHAVLVASPNEGTPLATPGRWDETLGWIANILDLFPPNPVTTNAAMVARWITWFAKVGVNAAEGLDSMNQRGEQIRELQLPPSPDRGHYSALISNFEPGRRLWARALDLGLDAFFDTANDLVVPAAGGWRIDGLLENIPAGQIGAFGPGGNIAEGAGPVSHIGFFSRPESQEFIARALMGKPQDLLLVDPGVSLPTSRRSISGQLSMDESEPVLEDMREVADAPPVKDTGATAQTLHPVHSIAAQPYSSVFELTVVDYEAVISGTRSGNSSPNAVPILYAAYGGARVTTPFPLRGRHFSDDDGAIPVKMESTAKEVMGRWKQLFTLNSWIKEYLDEGAKPPHVQKLGDFGNLLFETLFPGDVRRLYDVARARESDKLFLVFTSMIPWVFDMPWEFARDTARGTYLATEDVYFIRNVLTPTPVQKLAARNKLRMLVAIAEPTNLVPLSSAEEVAKLERELEGLIAAGLIEFDVLERATAQKIHSRIANGNYDVFHFIGHGYWDRSAGDSGLVLEDDLGQEAKLGGRSLREVLSGRGIRLVFLNACNTGNSVQLKDGSSTASMAGAAQDLFGLGVPNVIANQFAVGDDAAVAFARSIYAYLAKGKSVAQAVREARIAASYVTGSLPLDWAVPVVYACDPEDRLVDVQAVQQEM